MPTLSPDLTKGILTSAIGLVSTSVSVGFSWMKERNSQSRRLQVLDESTKRLAFWDSWLKMQLSQNPTDEQRAAALAKVEQESAAARQVFEKSFGSYSEAVAPHVCERDDFLLKLKRLPRWQRWLLLYKPPRPIAYIPRVFFWFYLVNTILTPLLVPRLVEQDYLEQHTFVPEMLFVIGLLIALALRALSLVAERPRLQHAEH